MRSNLRLSVLILSIGLILNILSSCKKDDPVTPVSNVKRPNVSFTYTTDGKNVKFMSHSQNDPTEFKWLFGDGNTGAGAETLHTYDTSGIYSVTVVASNSAGADSFTYDIICMEQVLRLTTDFGVMYMWLYDETPKHKANFIKLAKEGYYDNTTFHRIIQDFMIQGGDPNSKDDDPDNDGMGGPSYRIPAEIKPELKHVFGAVGAARTNNPQKESSGSQFYIVVNKQGTPHLDGNYTVFGQIIKGMPTAETIVKQPTSSDPADRPIDDIKMDVDVLERTKQEILSEYGYKVK